MKKSRHELILNYIKNNNISTQDEIIKMLSKHGFNVTQATISRDIKELKLVKEHYGKNEVKYAVTERKDNNDNIKMIFSRSVLSVEVAMNLIVVKCYPGTANAACVALDSLHIPGVVGTIAGDDTIFTACVDINAAVETKCAVEEMLKG
ncbi:MAG: arginine repressor [Clostridia bacterium]|nr:arginine repressor [Clostridia bacterium]